MAGVAGDDGVWVHDALERHRVGVADERAVAEVVILGCGAISRVGALADIGPACAGFISADIADSTAIAIVAPGLIGRIDTALLRLADIVSTAVVIVACQRLDALALAISAEVACGAQAPVFARIRVVGSVHTAALLIAGIVGARVVVIAGDGLARADILFAGVGLGAGIAVIAGLSGLLFVLTAILLVAGV